MANHKTYVRSEVKRTAPNEPFCTRCGESKAEIDRIEREIRRLTAALREYGQHKYDCPEVYFTVVPKPCNCGFARALTEMEAWRPQP